MRTYWLLSTCTHIADLFLLAAFCRSSRKNAANTITMGVALLCLFPFDSPSTQGQEYVVSPSRWENEEAPDVADLTGVPSYRFQKVHDASDFTALSSRPMWVTGIDFRPDASVEGRISYPIDQTTVTLSTTDVGPANISTTFSENIGPEPVVVFDDSSTFTSRNRGPVSGPRDFDYGFNFQTPYRYDPSAGNLLLDATIIDAEGPLLIDFDFNPATAGTTAQVFAPDVAAQVGLDPSGGNIARFDVTLAPPLDFGMPTKIESIAGILGGPAVTADGTELFFTYWETETDWDTHWASRENLEDEWFYEGPVAELNAAGRQTHRTLSSDGLTMIIGSEIGTTNRYDLLTSTRTDASRVWSEMEPLNISGTDGAGAPALSSDGLSLYLGGGWDYDTAGIRVSRRQSNDASWPEPMPLEGFEEVSTANHPAVTADELAIVYTNGTEHDLWIATRESTKEPFANHEPLGSIWNTSNFDTWPHLAPDGTLYYVRNAIRGDGDAWSIYETPLFPSSPCDATTLGDIDSDGTVGFSDFLILSQNFGKNVADHLRGDIDCSGSVEFADFLILSVNFGTDVGQFAAVPEPSGGMLIFLAALCVLKKRRLKHNQLETDSGRIN